MTSLEHSEAPHCTTGRVLVVDDNDPVRHMLSLALETAGFEVVQAVTQREVRRRLADTRPDALVLDLQRSEADGLALLGKLRARPDLASLPIVFLAACGDDDLRWQAMRAGADWFGLRPLGMVELQKRVGNLVSKGRPRLRAIAGTHRRRVAVRGLQRTG